ncbi:hypothetical protein [Phenylobacterium sp.]|uniref:hypothetical protein n=1 Tax=Phenylobacterium sp. TaxID=1871053 RepID=UPI002736306D|nr:hypothetical protein [Phenylobacterium sp.]MDP3855009.1 hypothetical protein [Phenylobacterium sp.]
MRHATQAALDVLEPLLGEVPRRSDLRERGRGVFYRKSRAWLHFHEDPAGLFADLRSEGDWLRIDVTDDSGKAALLRQLDEQDKIRADAPVVGC